MFVALIEKLYRRQDLSVIEVVGVMEEIMVGCAQLVQIVGFFIGFSMKGEWSFEVVGLAIIM